MPLIQQLVERTRWVLVSRKSSPEGSYQPIQGGSESPTLQAASTTSRRPLLHQKTGALLRSKLILSAGILSLGFLVSVVGPSPARYLSSSSADTAPALPNSAQETSFSLAKARAQLTKEEYIDAVLRNPIEGLVDPGPIRAKCDATVFQPGLVWHCDLINGGIGNVGNMWLNCLRYAIEAGATTIILPSVGARNTNDLHDLGDSDHTVGLETLYDMDYFFSSWKDACPQMRAVLSDEDIQNLPPLRKSPSLTPNYIGDLPRIKELVVNPAGWRAALDKWLTVNARGYATMSAEAPVRVLQRIALSHWNLHAHSHDFGISFPRLFRFSEPIRRIAASVLWSMENSTSKPVVSDAVLFPDLMAMLSSSSGTPSDMLPTATSLRPHLLAHNGFLGAHLRVAEDAAKAGWPGYEAQAPAYLDEAARRNLSVVYLATGSEKHRFMFRADAEKRGLHVLTKEELLIPGDLAKLKALSWDQQAIVDFEVLMHSSYFAGFVRSSFSWSLAIRRGVLPEAGQAFITKRGNETPWRPQGLARLQASPHPRNGDASIPIAEKYRDGLSVVVGEYDSMTIEGIWP